MIKIRGKVDRKARSGSKFILRREERRVKPSLKDLGYNEETRRLFQIEASVEELRSEAKQHESKALEARQEARDLLEEGRDYEAKKCIELMLAERQYILACGVTARRIRNVMDALRLAGKSGTGVSQTVADCVTQLDKAISSRVLVDIEKSLGDLEVSLEPSVDQVPSIVSLVERIRLADVQHIQNEIREELKFLTNLSGALKSKKLDDKRPHRNSTQVSESSEEGETEKSGSAATSETYESQSDKPGWRSPIWSR